jgi:hypothetical protein
MMMVVIIRKRESIDHIFLFKGHHNQVLCSKKGVHRIITKRKSNPKLKIQVAVAATSATLHTCALTKFLQCALLNLCSCELYLSNELWNPVFILLLLSCLGQLLILEAKNSILNIFFSQLVF